MNNIGIDLDDVLANFNNGWLSYYNNKYQTNYKFSQINNYDLEKVFKTKKDVMIRRIKNFYRTKIFEELKPINGTKSVINKINKISTISVITSRPLWLEEKTKNWLNKHFGKKFDNIILSNQFGNKSMKNLITKAQICKDQNINIMIEDAPTYSISIAKTGTKVLLFDRPWNRDIPNGKNITRVKSWKEIDCYISNNCSL